MFLYYKKISFSLLRIYFFLIPFQFIPGSIFYWPFRILPVLICLLELDTLLKFFKINFYKYFFILSFTLLSIVIAIGNNYFSLVLKNSFLYFFGYGIFLPILINKLNKKINQIKIFYSFSLGIILSSIVMVLFFFPSLKPPPNLVHYHFTGGVASPRLGLGGVNDYAIVILIHLVWLTYLVQEKIFQKRKLYLYLFYLLDIILLFFTGSRVAFFSIFVRLLFSKNIFNKKYLSLILLFVSIGGIIYLAFQSPGNIQLRIFNYFEIQSRLEFLDKYKEIQPFGTGIGTHRLINYFNIPFDMLTADMHNNFLILFYDVGYLIAPFFYIYLFLTIFDSERKRYVFIMIFFFNIFVITHITQDIFLLFLAISLSSLNPKRFNNLSSLSR